MEFQISKDTLDKLKFFGVILTVACVAVTLIATKFFTDSAAPLNIGRCVPTFYDGDGPYYKQYTAYRSKLAPDDSPGEWIKISGKLLNSDCSRVIPNATIDIWHADQTGNYTDEWHRGQIKTNDRGEYSFETIHPKGYGEGTGYRPPHIHYKVWVDGKLIVTSEIFFSDTLNKPGFNNAYIAYLDARGAGDYNIVLPNFK